MRPIFASFANLGLAKQQHLIVDAIPQLLARFEMRHELTIEGYGLARLGVTPYAWRAEMQGEAAETTDLDAIAGR